MPPEPEPMTETREQAQKEEEEAISWLKSALARLEAAKKIPAAIMQFEVTV